ncbi:hypothetical protein EJ07DRAFT_158960 [Lizonia empirigonia]|nr:hypothetical protein EJ07DRAFT_158960 [Lizonia empirigonia]
MCPVARRQATSRAASSRYPSVADSVIEGAPKLSDSDAGRGCVKESWNDRGAISSVGRRRRRSRSVWQTPLANCAADTGRAVLRLPALRASCAADPSCWVHEFVREEWWCSKQVIADGPRAKDHKLPTFRLVLPIAPSPDADASPSRRLRLGACSCRAVRCGAAGLNQSHVTITRGFQHVHENVVCDVTSPQLPLKDQSQTPTFTAYWRTNSRPALCLFRRGCPQGQLRAAFGLFQIARILAVASVRLSCPGRLR